MHQISHKSRPNSSHVPPTPKMSRMINTDVPSLPQTSRSATSTNKFVPPLLLRQSLQTNRLVPPMFQSSQSFNTSLPSNRKIGMRSITETIPSCSDPSIKAMFTAAQTRPPTKTLPNPSAQNDTSTTKTLPNSSAQNDTSGDIFDEPDSRPISAIRRHPGGKKGPEIERTLDDEIEEVGGTGQLPQTPDDTHTRGACKQIKTSRIVRTTREKIRVLYNPLSRRATCSKVHSLLVHDIGAIIRSHCPMNTGYWRAIPATEKKDLMDEITTNFEIDLKDSRLANYVSRLYNGRYREFKAELSTYYKLRKTHEDALANPPLEMLDRSVDQWVELCNHFNSEKLKKASLANIENRSKKRYNHRTGSRPLSYIVEEMTEDGSKFPEVDTFEFAYAGKNKCWNDSAAKAQHDAMLAKAGEYLTERAKEQQLSEDTPLEQIPVDDPDAGLKIMTSVLGVKPGRQIRGLGDGRLRDIGSSSNVGRMEKELEEERAARRAADAARIETEQRMQKKLKAVGNQFNSTLQIWYNSMQQLCSRVPGVVLPPFTPLSVDDDTNEENDDIGDEENDFDEDDYFGDDE